MAVFVGLDCGGTSCRALAIDETGAAVFRGQSGPANLLTTPRDLIRSHVAKALVDCPSADAAVACFAGLLTENEREFGLELLRERFPTAILDVVPDYCAPLKLAEPCSALVIAGTGSIIVSRSKGSVHKSGGRGFLFGDRGSAFRIGQAAVARFLSGAYPELSFILQGWCGSTAEASILAYIYSSQSPVATLARLAEPVGRFADGGGEACLELIASELRVLAEQVGTHLRNFGHPGPFDLVLAGGLWKASRAYQPIFVSELDEAVGAVAVRRLKGAPVEGAALLAKDLQ